MKDWSAFKHGHMLWRVIGLLAGLYTVFDGCLSDGNWLRSFALGLAGGMLIGDNSYYLIRDWRRPL